MPKIWTAPRTMNSTIAVTLIIANQYSNVPKLLTERAFTYSRMKAKPSDHSHTGAPGKPVGHVDAGGDGLAADRDHLAEPVGIADDEARPGIEIRFRIHAERARGRMQRPPSPTG